MLYFENEGDDNCDFYGLGRFKFESESEIVSCGA
jgi:hypothetical protein